MTPSALARDVTCTDCGKTFPGRIGGTRRCGACAQHRVAETLRARRGDTTEPVALSEVASADASATPAVPVAPPMMATLPEAPVRASMLPEDAARQITCAECGTVFVRTNWGGATPTRCKPCQLETNRAAARRRSEAIRSRRSVTPGIPRGGISPTAERAAATMANRMLDTDPACAGDDRFTAEPTDLAPGAAELMARMCRGCPLFEPCLLVAKTTKPAAGFWAGKHRKTRTLDAEEVTA